MKALNPIFSEGMAVSEIGDFERQVEELMKRCGFDRAMAENFAKAGGNAASFAAGLEYIRVEGMQAVNIANTQLESVNASLETAMGSLNDAMNALQKFAEQGAAVKP